MLGPVHHLSYLHDRPNSEGAVAENNPGVLNVTPAVLVYPLVW